MTDVLVVLGSISDKEHAFKALETLRTLGVESKVEVASAHRSPERVRKTVEDAEKEGVSVFMVIAGLSALLPSLIATYTVKPVIGVPVNRALGGLDSLLSIVQTPPGIPVACVGIGNVVNASLLAAEIVGLRNPAVAERLSEYRESLKRRVERSAEELKKSIQ